MSPKKLPNVSFWNPLERKKSLLQGRKSIIIYNRVPKCGSRTMLHLLHMMEKRHQINLYHEADYYHVNMSKKLQKKQVDSILKKKRPLVFEKHMYFFNFQR